MSDNYIHLGDFEKYVRSRFNHIINGSGVFTTRIAVKIALDDVFSEDASQSVNASDPKKLCNFCEYWYLLDLTCEECGEEVP